MASPVPATPENIAKAAGIIRSGGLVAFTTETVYGLGANALDTGAVASIFAAKGRPSSNPVIAHVASPDDAELLAAVDDRARRVMLAFWPGPVTLVLPRRPIVPDIVTAGGPTVALRMPRHPVALALIRAAGVPVAAPSANRSESLSPTRAQHVAESLGDAVAMILDGGLTGVGLESAVLDMTAVPARVLRPGMADIQAIGDLLGERIVTGMDIAADGPARSPGQMPRHYAPRTPLRIVSEIEQAVRSAEGPVALLVLGRVPRGLTNIAASIALPADADAYAAGLYDALHTLDAASAAGIVVQAPPEGPAWDAIWDRLRRAASPAA
jgi:L-threonylcarbamoyladenylate synthase